VTEKKAEVEGSGGKAKKEGKVRKGNGKMVKEKWKRSMKKRSRIWWCGL
jgi:hypothetical protein